MPRRVLRALVAQLAVRLGADDPRSAIDHVTRGLYCFAVSERQSLKLRARINTQLGHLEPQRATRVRGPMLDEFAVRIGRMGGLDVHEARMTMQTMTGIIMHFALLEDADLEQIAGTGGEAGRRILEDHVARVALRLVFRS